MFLVKLIREIFKYPIRLINYIYLKQYYKKGINNPDLQIDILTGKEDYLIISPEIGDGIIGLGGTLLKYRDKKANGTLICISEGKKCHSEENLKEVYGIENVYFINLEDKDIEKKMLNILRETNPEIVFTPFLLDGMKKHIDGSRLILSAIGKWNENFSNIWMYETNILKDLRLINRIITLDEKTIEIKSKTYKELMIKNPEAYRVFTEIDKAKTRLLGDKAKGIETFVNIDYKTAWKADQILLEKEFDPKLLKTVTNEYNLIYSCIKNKKVKEEYNNNLNYILKGYFLGDEIKYDGK